MQGCEYFGRIGSFVLLSRSAQCRDLCFAAGVIQAQLDSSIVDVCRRSCSYCILRMSIADATEMAHSSWAYIEHHKLDYWEIESWHFSPPHESVEPSADWTEKNTIDIWLSPRTENVSFQLHALNNTWHNDYVMRPRSYSGGLRIRKKLMLMLMLMLMMTGCAGDRSSVPDVGISSMLRSRLHPRWDMSTAAVAYCLQHLSYTRSASVLSHAGE